MKIGVIVVFDSIQDLPPIEALLKPLNKSKDVVFCFVNNNAGESLSEYLLEISESAKDVTFLTIKRTKSLKSAVRFGERYLNSHYNLKVLGYLDFAEDHDLVESLNFIKDHKMDIKNDFLQSKSTGAIRNSILKSVFSILKYINKFNEGNNDLAKVIG